MNLNYLPSTNKNLIRAAKIELLVADAINHPSMINKKVEAYTKATEYFYGQKFIFEIKISNNYDIYSGLLQLSPFLCKFLLKTMKDSLEVLRMSSIKGIEFLIEHLGCSLGWYLPNILS